jgi:hypothetical protein
MNYATVWIAPKRDFAILACTNQGGAAGQAACDAAVTVLIDHHAATAGAVVLQANSAPEKTEPLKASPVARVATAVLEKYVGVYEITPEFAMTVTVEDGKLIVQATGQGKLFLDGDSATKFSVRGVDAKVTFVGDDDGKFSRLVLHQNGANKVAKRRETVEADGAEEKLESFVGVYAITPQFEMTVTVEEGKLMVQVTGQGKLPLERESATKFSCKMVDAGISFVKDDDGKFSRLILEQNGANQVATRK